MELRTMYPPQKDSPTTFLQGAILATDTSVIVGNATLFASLPLPFPLTLGIDKTITETVLVTEINTGNNRITFTRGTPAYQWPNGTNVGRVFNASDLSAIQENVKDIYTKLTDMDESFEDVVQDVTALQSVVGNEDSGLVKGLADEIIRATASETAEVQRATAAETNLENKKIDRTELPQILINSNYAADETKVQETYTRYNASNKQTTEMTRTLPVVSSDAQGVMTPEAYNEITALRSEVNALQQQGGKFIGISFDTKAALDSYEIPDSVNVGDYTYVLDDETKDDAVTRYVYDGDKFEFAFIVESDPVGLATSSTPGLVKSDGGTTDGKVFVEADGTMSLVGWQKKVDKNTTVNGKPLSENVTLTASDVGANISVVETTLSTEWSGSGPFTQNIPVTGMTPTRTTIVGLSNMANPAEREVARKAMLQATTQNTDVLVITADGDKPTIGLPITIFMMP